MAVEIEAEGADAELEAGRGNIDHPVARFNSHGGVAEGHAHAKDLEFAVREADDIGMRRQPCDLVGLGPGVDFQEGVGADREDSRDTDLGKVQMGVGDDSITVNPKITIDLHARAEDRNRGVGVKDKRARIDCRPEVAPHREDIGNGEIAAEVKGDGLRWDIDRLIWRDAAVLGVDRESGDRLGFGTGVELELSMGAQAKAIAKEPAAGQAHLDRAGDSIGVEVESADDVDQTDLHHPAGGVDRDDDRSRRDEQDESAVDVDQSERREGACRQELERMGLDPLRGVVRRVEEQRGGPRDIAEAGIQFRGDDQSGDKPGVRRRRVAVTVAPWRPSRRRESRHRWETPRTRTSR